MGKLTLRELSPELIDYINSRGGSSSDQIDGKISFKEINIKCNEEDQRTFSIPLDANFNPSTCAYMVMGNNIYQLSSDYTISSTQIIFKPEVPGFSIGDTVTIFVLSANDPGSIGKDLLTNVLVLEIEGKLDKTDIVNNLTTTDSNKALDARQGKILDDKIVEYPYKSNINLEDIINEINEKNLTLVHGRFDGASDFPSSIGWSCGYYIRRITANAYLIEVELQGKQEISYRQYNVTSKRWEFDWRQLVTVDVTTSLNNKIENLSDRKIDKLVTYKSGGDVSPSPNEILDGTFLVLHKDNPIPNSFCYFEQYFYGAVSVESNRIQIVTSYNNNGPTRQFIRRYFDGTWTVDEIATTTKTDIPFPYSSGFEKVYDTDASGVSKCNNFVTINLNVIKTDNTEITSHDIIATLPSGYRPPKTIFSTCFDGRYVKTVGVVVRDNGYIQITSYVEGLKTLVGQILFYTE